MARVAFSLASEDGEFGGSVEIVPRCLDEEVSATSGPEVLDPEREGAATRPSWKRSARGYVVLPARLEEIAAALNEEADCGSDSITMLYLDESMSKWSALYAERDEEHFYLTTDLDGVERALATACSELQIDFERMDYCEEFCPDFESVIERWRFSG